jgi:hypothetical protein
MQKKEETIMEFVHVLKFVKASCLNIKQVQAFFWTLPDAEPPITYFHIADGNMIRKTTKNYPIHQK